MAEPRYEIVRYDLPCLESACSRCLDCGMLLLTEDKPSHTRFHSILSAQAWAIAVLITAHLGPRTHDKWNVKERIDSKRFDNWSADALAEVMKEMNDEQAGDRNID